MTHQIAGVGLAAVAGAALDTSTTTAVVLVGAAWVGSMLPDADMAGSRVYRRTKIERRNLLARVVGRWYGFRCGCSSMLPHRGITHSLRLCGVAAIVTAVLVNLVAPTVALAAGSGSRSATPPTSPPTPARPAASRSWRPCRGSDSHLLPKHARIPTGSLREYATAAALVATLVAAAVVLG